MTTNHDGYLLLVSLAVIAAPVLILLVQLVCVVAGMGQPHIRFPKVFGNWHPTFAQARLDSRRRYVRAMEVPGEVGPRFAREEVLAYAALADSSGNKYEESRTSTWSNRSQVKSSHSYSSIQISDLLFVIMTLDTPGVDIIEFQDWGPLGGFTREYRGYSSTSLS